MAFTVVACARCGKRFEKRNAELNTARKLGLKHTYCSRLCAGRSVAEGKRGQPVEKVCPGCGKGFLGLPGPKANKYCSKECACSAKSRANAEARYRSYVAAWKSGEVSGTRGVGDVSKHVRRYLFEKYGNRCARCGWSKINSATGKVPLEVEHKDGDWRNCCEANLVLICPCCHAITPTFRNLNRGRGRPRR